MRDILLLVFVAVFGLWGMGQMGLLDMAKPPVDQTATAVPMKFTDHISQKAQAPSPRYRLKALRG